PATLTHHDPAPAERHLRMESAWRLDPHILGEPKSARKPVERGGHVATKEVRNDLRFARWVSFSHWSLLRGPHFETEIGNFWTADMPPGATHSRLQGRSIT